MKPIELVDAYISNDEAIKRLEGEQKVLREAVLALGSAELAGTTRKIKISTSDRKTVDWKMLAAEVGVPASVIESFTRVSSVTTLKVV